MTHEDWMAARSLLYEERIGIHLSDRVRERDRIAKEQAVASDYKRSVQDLKRQQQDLL